MFKASKRSIQEVVQILNWEIEQSIQRVVEKLEKSEEQELSFIIQIKNSFETKEFFIHCDENGTAEVRSSYVAVPPPPIKIKDLTQKPAKAKKITAPAGRKTAADAGKSEKDSGLSRSAEAPLAQLDVGLDS